MCPLGLINSGELCEILQLRIEYKKDKEIRKCNNQFNTNRLEELGIRKGSELEMIKNTGDGSILVKVENSRIALPHKISMKIYVRRK